MKIAIIGTGGVGGYFGGKLARAGYDVTFLARGEHLKAIQQNGLTIKSIQGDFTVVPVKTTDRISAIGSVDLVILAVKAWQIKEIATELAIVAGRDTMVLPLQNGVSATDELKEVLERNNIIGGLCRIISKIKSPGVIIHSGIEPVIVFGELDNAETERIHKVKAAFDRAGITARISDDIMADLWKKFIPNDSTSSLTRDIWHGKPSELEYQNGTVVKLGELYKVETPVNRFVYNCLLPLEIKARSSTRI